VSALDNRLFGLKAKQAVKMELKSRNKRGAGQTKNRTLLT